jgi:hypothetical protein
MKKMIVFAAFIFCAGVLQAQTQPKEELTKSFSFQDSTSDQNLYFTVKEGTPNIGFIFNVTLSKGRLRFTVTDPEGKKCGNFSLDKDSKGQFSDNEKSPLPGKWTVHLTMSNATGTLSYEVKMNDN